MSILLLVATLAVAAPIPATAPQPQDLYSLSLSSPPRRPAPYCGWNETIKMYEWGDDEADIHCHGDEGGGICTGPSPGGWSEPNPCGGTFPDD